MKYLLVMWILLFVCVGNGQSIGEQEAIAKNHLDFTTEYIFFVIANKIEINGHIFDNLKEKCPIIFKADIRGISIVDTCQKIEYVYRDCGNVGCKIIHLVKKSEIQKTETVPGWRWFNYDAIPTLEFDKNELCSPR